MPTIQPIVALKDNYIWLITQNQKAIVIDPGEASPVIAHLKEHRFELCAIWITHHHHDHIGGVDELLTAYPNAKLYAHKNHGLNSKQLSVVDEGAVLDCFGWTAVVWRTFGHTDSHLSYVLTTDKKHVFCGDTLFRAGCGRVFTGTIDQLYDSFVHYNALPDETLFYPAHEYTLANLRFAQSIEPNNIAIKNAIASDSAKIKQNHPTLPSSLADERKINPFLRSLNPNDELYQNAHKSDNTLIKGDTRRLFAQLRHLKNNA